MTYQGCIRMDLGPMLPRADTINAIERNGINGMECACETADSGKLTVEVFDDYAILNVLDASELGESFQYLVSPAKIQKGVIYTITGDSPEFGMLGDPVRAAQMRGKLYKALAIHGKVKESGKVQSEGYPPLLIMKVCAQGLTVSAAIKFSAATQDMKNLNTQIISGLEPWVKVSGYGEMSFVKMDGKRRMRLYINNIRHFEMAPNRETDWGSADPLLVKKLCESA